jgi:DNA repair protein RadC
MSKKKIVFNAYDLLNSPEMSAYLDQVEAEESERQKRRDAEMAARQRQSGSKPGHSVSDDELSADDLKRDNIRQTTDDISGRANDVWQALKSGGAQLIQGAGWLANEAGAHDSGQFLRDIGQIGEDQALANMTPAGREAQKNGVFKEDLSGVNDDWGRGMAQGIAGSAVPSIVGAVLGAPVARGIGAAGNALLGRAAVSEGALGSVLDAAIKYTPAPVMRLAGALPGAAGAGAGEAAVTGATNGAQAYQEVMDAPIKSLRKSPAFQSLSKELGSEDAARKAIADRMSIQTAKDTALSTGLIGAAMGGGAVGSLLNKFAVKQGAKEVGRLGAKAAAKEVLKDGAKEFAEEFAQSGPEHYLQNAAKRDYLDPTIDPSTGMLRASLEGGVVGMGQGMGMSGGAHAVNRLLARNEPQPSQPANTPQQQPNTQPSSTPKSAAGYDPIAPNQQALLQRLGVEPDPAADEAAASVESIFGTGDPTAGLVASVMRGDAMQPVHDMAAVRANTVLPVGSNEGGLYEPQWLPDAASGESSNGMRMPRRGFDSQEQLLANAGMDAQDMQRQANIASQIDAAWAQQQNPVQKARELESLAQESAVPVAIDRAEQSNQINQALANAAGEGVAVPNAMQLALQQAKSRHASVPDASTHALPTELPTELKSNSVDAQRTHGDDKSREIATNHTSVEIKAPNISKEDPNTSGQAPNISSEPALTMQQNERGQWMIKGDMAQHGQTIREALPGTKLVVSQKSGQALVQMPADKNTGKQGKAIRKALDHLLLSGEQLAARDQQRADASERAKAANRQAQQIDPERDDIVNAVAKLGGIDTEQALSEWWRGQRETIGHYNAEVPGNLRRQGVFAFKRGGMPIDDMVRHLEGEGYLPHNATPNDLLDALENRSKHPAGHEADARREFDARQQEEQANAPGEFQQAYDEGGFADEFTKRELEEETDYFELNRQNREAAEDAAATAKAAALDALIDNAPVIPSRPGPVTEEELDAIFGQQSRNAAAEGTQTDREPAAGRSMEGAESGTATAEAAPEEDGFGLAGYTESDLRREEQAAEQQQREVERQRAAADKARQDEETRKEIRRRSEAAADTFTLGGNAEDNLTGQGGLFDAPAEAIHKPINMVSKSDGSGFATRDALRAAATRDGVPQSSLIEKRDDAGNWIGIRHEPDSAIDRIIADQSRAGKVIGTSVRDLHSDDVYTLLMAAGSKKQINAIADYIGKYAPRAAADAVKSHIDSALKQKGWATEESLYGGGLFDAPTESSSAPTATDEMAALKAEMGDAIGELASILGARKNLTPDEESKIIPVMSKIFRIAAKMGYVKFKDAAQHVMSQIRQLAGNEIADKLSIDNLQAGYINIASEIGGDKREALAYDSIEELEKEHVTDQHSGADLERDSANAAPENRMGAQGVRAGRSGDGRAGRSGVEDDQGEVGQRDSGSIDGHEAAAPGERSDSEIYAGASRVTAGSAGSRVDIGSADSGVAGLPVEPNATSQVARVATSGHRKQLDQQRQHEADKHVANASVAEALPLLTEGQQQDVVKAEARFAVPDGYGMLFTNGTGTGKTFTGLGAIKRFVNNGKTNILVVAPNDKIIEDWQRSGKLLGLDLTRLESTTAAGSGPVITTYANMGANNELASREWDLIVHDEAHYLAMDKDGTNTNALKALRAISLHPDGVYRRHSMLNSADIERVKVLTAQAKGQNSSDDPRLHLQAKETQAEADKLANELADKLEAIKADVAARQGEARPRVLFLSATPFAYEKTIDWANGYLFDYNEGRGKEENGHRGYNEGSNREQFFMQHFGYRMRYGKLTAPDAKVDSGLMQRQFNAYLKKRGALSGRMLDVKADYDRRFILVDSAIGQRIDDALEWLGEKARTGKAYQNMLGDLNDKFDYLARRYLLESIKAKEVVPHIREHLALGRKVVVFHDYKKGGGFNPFNFTSSNDAEHAAAISEFRHQFRDIINSDLFRQSSPIDMFRAEFPGVLLFNGDIPVKERRANVQKFQDDASGPQVILVQSAAGKEGISLHDTTGKHQRVLFNLGQPTQPTTAIQQEGRIYRTGQVTDAIFRYLNTGTNWEKWAFATTIAQRASAAENLGMGEMARALKDAFIAAFEESSDFRAGMEGEGKGGKERDRAANEALTEYDRARSFYFGTQKKTAQTKAKEGKDYFATPEPVGLKMAEFADVRPGESVLEPSAGHGAIARWFPEDANRTAIEPSMTLRSRLAMVFDGNIVGSDFEDHNIVNKYDAIVMNPSFGVGGKTAVEHLAKAAGHLREGGRIVALLPVGPTADKRMDNFLYGEVERSLKPQLDHPTLGPVYRGDTLTTNASWAREGTLQRRDKDGTYWLRPTGSKREEAVDPAAWTAVKATGQRKETYRPAGDLHLVADIKLPAVAFERAGTAVMTHIIVLEKAKDGANIQQINRDLTGIDDIHELFNRMENMELPKRTNAAEARTPDRAPVSNQAEKAADDTAPASSAASADIVEHVTGKGKTLRGVIRTDMTLAQAKAIDPYTFKKDGGYFIRERYLSDGKLERREPSLNGGAIDSNEPKADYTDYYETDLFGNPLPNAGRKARATKTAQPEVRRNVLAASTVQGDTPAPDGDYKVRTIVGSESQRKLGARSITSVADLAAATSYLYRSAVERFDAIVTDASGKPLAAIGAFKGAIDQVSVYPATLVGEAVRIPGAAHVWFSHNHPSGTAKLSDADRSLYHRLADVFDGSGITPMGLIAVANRQYASMEDSYLPIPQSSESMSVHVVERELSATDIDMPAITSPQVAKELAGAMYKGSEYQPGMMLLNTQNQVAAWVPLPATAMGALRHSGGLNAIYRAISESNAGAVILVHGGELSERIGSVTLGQNIAAAVAKLDVRPLDIIDIRKPRSAAETGEQIQSGPVYSKANDYTSTQGMSAKELQTIIAKALPAHLRERVKVEQSRSNTARQSARPEDRDLTDAEYDPATGQLTLYADAIPTPERALFVLSHELTHYGLDAKYGFGLSSILLEARNNPMIAKLAAAIAVDRGMAVNSVRQDIADARGVPVARVARSAAVHRLQVETANEALAELNAAIERNDFAYLQDRYGVAVPKMMRNDLRGRLSRLAASVKAWLAKLTGKQATDYSDKQVWDLLAGVRETVRGGGNVAESDGGWRNSGGNVAETQRSTAPKQPASAGFVLPEETTAQQAQREVQDNMNRWKQVLEIVREQGGQVDEQNDVYSAEERFHGRAATRIEDFARDEVEPLMERLAKSGHTLQEVEQYLLAQHAEEANARIREIDDSRDTAFGMEDAEAQSILAKFAAMPDAAEFKRLANDFRHISEGTLSLYVKARIRSPEAAHAMRLAYQFYVPVKGGDEDQAARQGTGKGLSVNGKQKRRMGHDMRDEHVLENILRDRQRAIVLAEKNNVGTYLLDLIARNPDPKLWTVNVLPKQKVLRDQVSYVVELNGQMLDAFNSLEAARVFIQAEASRTGSKPGAFAVSKSSDPYVTMMAKPMLQENEVLVYVQGQEARIQLHDPIMAGQYRRMGTEQMGRIIEAGKSLNRWLSKVYTGYNPEFFIKNVVRDLFAGSINLTADQGGKVAAKALSHWPKAGAAMFRFALTGKAPAGEYGKALQRYRAAGGSTGAAYMGDLERQADTLTELYENYTGAMAAMQEGKPVKAAKIATRKLLGGLAHWFEVWNQAGENAFRLATFMAMEDAGKTVAQSASMAKNVTVNFNRKGELTPQLGGLYLFFNPNVQGTARLWQSLAGKDTKHKKQTWALVGSMAGAALAIAMMNRGDDEDEWEAIPDSVKDRNLIIPLGNKRKLTIPLPYGYSFFVSLANRLDAVMHGESAEKASIRLASAVFENFSPVGNPVGDDPKLENTLLLLPTALKIPALPAANLSGFGGQMRPEYDRSQPDNEKMWRGTRGSMYDKASQAISGGAESIGIGSRYENDWADISPETIKYLVKTLTGGTGGFLADSASLLNVMASGSVPEISEVPFVRSGMRESTVKDARARFHELGNEAKEHVAAWKRAVDAGDDKAATEYEQDGELMAMGEMLEGYRKQAKSLRDLMALEMQREDLTLAEKRMKQKAYENQEAEVYREFIRQFKH